MKKNNGYGVVYTPDALSDFVATLLVNEFIADNDSIQPERMLTVLDPACGECSLLIAAKKAIDTLSLHDCVNFIGVDIEKEVIETNKQKFNTSNFSFHIFNSLLPSEKTTAIGYWSKTVKNISLIIANPPWSSEKIFPKEALNTAGYAFDVGQYDSYVLFMELCLNIIQPNGLLAFIIPDSIFASENQELRKYLAENTELKVIARLGEKIFPGVNRATTVLIIKKSMPGTTSFTKCFRLNTEQRKRFLAGDELLIDAYQKSMHRVEQNRFKKNIGYTFDVDTLQSEEALLNKMEHNSIAWGETFHFGRGVEIAKSGLVVVCSECKMAQGYSKQQFLDETKKCSLCGASIQISPNVTEKIIEREGASGFEKIYVGENVQRYSMEGSNFIRLGVAGINYKKAKLYAPPKILIRKTGLGINACIDYASTYTSQTVYSCNYLSEKPDIPLAYYLGVLNSRIMYYYYLKKYGENEWKSHPYLTKKILFSFPVPAVKKENRVICEGIAKLAMELQNEYSRAKDIELENMTAQLYEIDQEEMRLIVAEINRLPNLGAINHMKFREDELCFGI